MIAVIVAKSTNGRARLTAKRTYVQQLSMRGQMSQNSFCLGLHTNVARTSYIAYRNSYILYRRLLYSMLYRRLLYSIQELLYAISDLLYIAYRRNSCILYRNSIQEYYYRNSYILLLYRTSNIIILSTSYIAPHNIQDLLYIVILITINFDIILL